MLKRMIASIAKMLGRQSEADEICADLKEKAQMELDLAILKYLFAGVADKWIVGGMLNADFGARKARGKNMLMITGVQDFCEFEKFWELWTGMTAKEYYRKTGEFPPYNYGQERVAIIWFHDHELWQYLERVKHAAENRAYCHLREIVADLHQAGWPPMRIAAAAQKAGRMPGDLNLACAC